MLDVCFAQRMFVLNALESCWRKKNISRSPDVLHRFTLSLSFWSLLKFLTPVLLLFHLSPGFFLFSQIATLILIGGSKYV